jgi:hypothetical protein
MEFIQGAAYVSPSRNEVYTGNGDGLYTRGGHWVDPSTKSMPDDLVCIWKPGDRIEYRWPDWLDGAAETVILDSDAPSTPDEWTGKSRQRDRLIKRIGPGGETWQHPKLKGWFYPTRYNETPGRYEDEEGNRWTFRKTEQYPDGGWYFPLWNEWFDIPQLEGDPAAVRWVGELDE